MTCHWVQVISLNMLRSLTDWKVSVPVLEILFCELVASVCINRCRRCNMWVLRQLWPMRSSIWIVSKSRRITSTLFPQVPRPSATTNDENHAENPHIAKRCHYEKLGVHHSLSHSSLVNIGPFDISKAAGQMFMVSFRRTRG